MKPDVWNKHLHDFLYLNNITQKEAAQIMEITESTLSRWLNGKGRPTLEAMINFCAETGADLNALCGLNSKQKMKDTNKEEKRWK